MKPKIYLFPYISHTTPFIELEDYQKLALENKNLSADLEYYKGYCDRLVEFGNLPCLPKDLENLREANGQFAQDNQVLLKLAEDLNAENRCLINKWEESLDHSDDLADQLFAARKERAKAEEWAAYLAREVRSLKEEIRRADKTDQDSKSDNMFLEVKSIGQEKEIEIWKNKWNIAVEMAAIAENKLAEKEEQRKNWQSGWDKMRAELEIVQSKLDKIGKIL